MATVLDEISAALKEIGVLSAGETASAEDAADAFAALNRMIDQWAAERLDIYSITRTTWTIVSGTQAYTVGLTGTVVIARPVFLQAVQFRDTSTSPVVELPLTPLSDAAYAGITLKAGTSTYPTSWYYNPTHPLGALTLFPTPTSTTLQGVLYAPAALARYTALSDLVTLPPAYEEFLVTHLAMRLATPFGRQIDPSLRERAMEAKAIVKRSNRRLTDMTFDHALVGNGSGSWSILSGP